MDEASAHNWPKSLVIASESPAGMPMEIMAEANSPYEMEPLSSTSHALNTSMTRVVAIATSASDSCSITPPPSASRVSPGTRPSGFCLGANLRFGSTASLRSPFWNCSLAYFSLTRTSAWYPTSRVVLRSISFDAPSASCLPYLNAPRLLLGSRASAEALPGALRDGSTARTMDDGGKQAR